MAGKDPGNKWHLIATTVKSSLATNTFDGFTHLRLLAVTSSGVADRRDFKKVEKGQEVTEEEEEKEDEVEKEETENEKGEEEKKDEVDEEKGEHYTFNFSLKLHSLSFLALPGCLALLLLFILLLIERWCNVRKRNKREEIHSLDSVAISGNEKETNKKTKEGKDAIQDMKANIDEFSNSLPTYVEATQSLDSAVVVSKNKNSTKENTKVEKKEKEEKIGMKTNKVPEFSNILLSNGPIRPVSHKVPEFSNSLVHSGGRVRSAPLKVPEFSNSLGFSDIARPSSPLFSIVTISCPTAVDNLYEDVENPYGLTRSNSFRVV